MQKRWQAVIPFLAVSSLFALAFVLASAPALAQGCTTPTSGMRIEGDTLLCAGSYDLLDGLTLAGANSVLGCDGAVLRGPGVTSATVGLLVVADGVDLRNCVVQNFGVGLRARGVLNLRQTGLSFAGNGQETDVAAGEEIELPSDTTPTTPDETPLPEETPPPETTPTPESVTPPPIVVPPPVPFRPNTSMWLVQDIQSEALLENSLQFEHNATVSEVELAKRVGELRDFLENVAVQREFIYRGGQTTVRITLKPKSGFFRRVIYQNITLYEYIPKCFSQLVDTVVFEKGQPTVLDPDPLVKKVLGKEDLTFEYRAPIVASPECQRLFKLIGLGEGKQVRTLGSVLADEGLFAVVRIFPGESATVIIFFVVLAAAGLWYKREIEREI
jgi:hypothetical protein